MCTLDQFYMPGHIMYVDKSNIDDNKSAYAAKA